MLKYIFCTVFLISVFFQYVHLVNNPLGDNSIWSTASSSVRTDNPQTFPMLDAYMHPGGSVIEGTIVVHEISRISYENALLTFLILFDSFLIATICMLCYVLRKNLLWPIAVLLLFSFQPVFAESSLYYGLTPPSIIASFLLPLLMLMTLYVCENSDRIKNYVWVFWCVLAGMIAATRIDVGGIMVAAFLLFLLMRFSFERVFILGLGSLVAFFLFDPFMWFAPATQVMALISAMTNHYVGSQHDAVLNYLRTDFLRKWLRWAW